MRKIIIFTLLFFSMNTYSQQHWLRGNVTNITTLSDGLLIILDTGRPPSCTQTNTWMLIPEENKTMISVALAMYLQGKTDATVYVDASAPGVYCRITQYDPH